MKKTLKSVLSVFLVATIILVVALFSAILLFQAYVQCGIAYGADDMVIELKSDDTNYVITANGTHYKTIKKDLLKTQAQQSSLLSELDASFSSGYQFKLGDEIFKLTPDKFSTAFGKTNEILSNLAVVFSGYEQTNESYIWQYRKVGQSEWTVDSRERTSKYAFGIISQGALELGDYEIQASVDYSFYFGGKNFGQRVLSDIVQVKISASDDYSLKIPQVKIVYGTKLSAINFSYGSFYNQTGTWRLADSEIPSRIIEKGKNIVKCTFKPNNLSLLPKTVDLNMYGVLKEIKVIVKNSTSVFGKFDQEKLSYHYEGGYGNQLMEGDTISDVGIKLKLVNYIDNSAVDEITAGSVYRILGDVQNPDYSVNFANEFDPDSYWKNKGGEHTVLFDKLNANLNNIGTVTVSREQGFDIQLTLSNTTFDQKLPSQLSQRGKDFYALNAYKTVFVKDGAEVMLLGEIKYSFSQLDNKIVAVAYYDGTNWTKVETSNGYAEFQAKGVQNIIFIGQYTEDWNSATIVLGVFLALGLLCLTFLIKTYVGGKKNV